MRISSHPYPKPILPKGFTYPERYLQFAGGVDVPDGFIWAFPSDQFDHASNAWKLRHHWGAEGWLYLDVIDPIPFAREGDLAAFFDGNDHSGDPGIVVADLGNKKGCFRLENFDAWWNRAFKDAGLAPPPE